MKVDEKADKCHCFELFLENFTLNIFINSINEIYV